ncbi:RNA polymerase sigma factor [Pseudonocardia broussonetiae]|uniref:Sigma-70 family RNA polymerase sigma factor n=1 Tax=Pseudonocardia broussonetiae TaxID=2736640 RepID=A0A6M6JJY9_9PSEU|nr:sigma-70 family RNA polymerase sigma factor [Pseudonocardia broussonetiae]QJY46739.1 sigma-70 family RNA polymerase sigma factor [Pseudonocardia broussonetiae]
MNSGDRAAFEAFVLAHGPGLVAFARRLTLDHHRAEDVVQDVLARMAPTWPPDARDPLAYVHTAVLRQFLSWRRRFSSRERPGPDVGADVGAHGGFADDVVERHRVHRALAALPPAQRAVLVLRYHHDRADAEIAALMGCRESTVRSHARRGIAALRAAGLLDPTSEETLR